jgi:type II secretory pathway pseudopilin PulG
MRGTRRRAGRQERPGPKGRRQAGYNLVALAVAITLLNIFVAAALPMWSTAMKREREEELIFRGLQYAEGIRLFQRRFGRLPVRLEEMIKVQPRCLRQLWKDPMTESGKWGLIFANAPTTNRPGRGPRDQTPPGQPPRNPSTDGGIPAPGQEGEETVTIGPLTGVRSLSTDESLLEFNGQTTYDAWQFTVGMVTGAVGTPGQPGGIPNLNVRWVGRPLRKGLRAPTSGVPAELRDVSNVPQPPPPGANPGGEQTPPPAGTGNQGGRRRTLPNTLGGGQG